MSRRRNFSSGEQLVGFDVCPRFSSVCANVSPELKFRLHTGERRVAVVDGGWLVGCPAAGLVVSKPDRY